MDEGQAKRIIEALLFVFSEPVALKRLSDVIQVLGINEIRQMIEQLNSEYDAAGRAFHIQEVAGGYQLVTDEQLSPWLRRALQSPRADAVSKGALETLAIVAYRQPITKAEIEAIRGVDISASLDTLVERNFIKVTGRKESPGRPFLYGTTSEFLRHFGLRSLEALPALQTPTVEEQTDAQPSAKLPETAAAPSGAPESTQAVSLSTDG